MKRIPLTQGKFAIVDDEDFERINRYKWHLQKAPRVYYANRIVVFEGLYDNVRARLRRGLTAYKRIYVSMPRQILGLCMDDARMVDHINHNGLDNRRCNLRVCTKQQNVWNSRKVRGSKRKYKGTQKLSSGRWMALIGGISLGTFDSEINAAKAYDEAAKKRYGEFACTNFK